jgi:hypothetical protein
MLPKKVWLQLQPEFTVSVKSCLLSPGRGTACDLKQVGGTPGTLNVFSPLILNIINIVTIYLLEQHLHIFGNLLFHSPCGPQWYGPRGAG